MSKFCVFCGEKPTKKTKEHVIPQWLIKMTEHHGRQTAFGQVDGERIVFPWKKYTFPACKTCNEKYSELEGKIKVVIEKLLDFDELSQIDINNLLDWFDKVRIGLWLGQSLINGEELNPKFYINQRIGISDRLLIINRSFENYKCIVFSGTNSLAFKYTPSCFSLTINNLTFVNYSSAMLLTKNMGFPYPDDFFLSENGQMGFSKINKGLNKVVRPLLSGHIIEPAIKIYQTILAVNGDSIINTPVSNYMINNSISYSDTKLISKLFIIDDFSDYFGFLQDNEKVTFNLTTGYPFESLLKSTAIVVFKHQNIEIERALKTFDRLPEDLKKQTIELYKNMRILNNKFISNIEQELQSLQNDK